ncbi:MAG: hypothetical protein Q8918_14795 [Bacteroidota bacterium]|nr:hypothetical protein [Bacteroidota bacterium]
MKRIIAILLIGILLFNWVGYQLYTAIMEQHADKTLIADLDQNNYAESELISIKVPAVHLSYYVNSKDFERVDGRIELEGVQYNYVKRRYINDSLELLCIPNKKATALKSAKDDFFKLVNDLQLPGQSKKADQHTASFKCFNGEYYADQAGFTLQAQAAVSLKATDRYLLQISSVSLSRAGQPPDMAMYI